MIFLRTLFNIYCESLRRKKNHRIDRAGLNWTFLPARFSRRKESRSCLTWRCRGRPRRWMTTYMARVSTTTWWVCVMRQRKPANRCRSSSRTRLTRSLITSPSRRHRSVIRDDPSQELPESVISVDLTKFATFFN